MILQLKFQQSFAVSVDKPQIPFIDRVVDISVASQRLVPQCLLCRRPEIPWCSSGMVVDMPVGVPTTGLWFRQCRKLWCSAGAVL